MPRESPCLTGCLPCEGAVISRSRHTHAPPTGQLAHRPQGPHSTLRSCGGGGHPKVLWGAGQPTIQVLLPLPGRWAQPGPFLLAIGHLLWPLRPLPLQAPSSEEAGRQGQGQGQGRGQRAQSVVLRGSLLHLVCFGFVHPHPRVFFPLAFFSEWKRERQRRRCEKDTAIGCLPHMP